MAEEETSGTVFSIEEAERHLKAALAEDPNAITIARETSLEFRRLLHLWELGYSARPLSKSLLAEFARIANSFEERDSGGDGSFDDDTVSAYRTIFHTDPPYPWSRNAADTFAGSASPVTP